MSETRAFATTRRGVLALADWLRCWQVPAVVMEATSSYWVGPFFRLEAEGLECVLADGQAGQEPARPAQAGPVGFQLAGAVLRARRGPAVLRRHDGVPD